MQIRDAVQADFEQITAIYNDVLTNSTAIYNDRPATVEDRVAWWRTRLEQHFPVLIAIEGERVCGFGSYGDFRSWPGYRYTVEGTVHIASGLRGQGVGSLLLNAQIPASFAGIVERFKETEQLEAGWLSKASETELERIPETRSSRLGIDVSVRQALLQICMHTQGHRSQCATRLRALGGTPPGMDYVLWIKEQTS